MSWPRHSLFIALVALSAQWAAADTLTVNTTADTVANDDKCSLREAVEYFNRDKPAGGYMGCRPPAADELDEVVLPASKSAYQISGNPIRVHNEVLIRGAGRFGDNKTTVAVNGAHRAFLIFDEPQYRAPACAASSSCEPAGTNSPYNDAPHLDNSTDTGASSTDNLTESHIPLFTGTVQVPAFTSDVDVTNPDPATRVETTTDTVSRVYVILYGTPLGGERRELIGAYADDTTGAWSLQIPSISDGQHSIVYRTRIDKVVTTTTVTYNTSDNSVRSTESQTDTFIGTTLSADSAAATVTLYSVPVRIMVSLTDLELVGCGEDAGCADEEAGTYTYTHKENIGLIYDYVVPSTAGYGGLIYVKEKLLLENVLLRAGVATTGGAVYLASDAAMEVTTSEFDDNKADVGAAVYAEMNETRIATSLLRRNIANLPAGAVVQMASDTMPSMGNQANSEFINTTFSGNDAIALDLHDGMEVNGATIVLNSRGGIDFNGENVQVYNTILAGNLTDFDTDPAVPTGDNDPLTAAGPFPDCIGFESAPIDPALPSIMKNSLVIVGGGCPESGNGIQAISNVAGSFGQLMATDVGGGTCNSTYGLLCPLADNGGESWSHKPHLLSLYTSMSDSTLINRGALDVGAGEGACQDTDQRGKNRVALNCDIGAVELEFVASGASVLSGGNIYFGQTYKQSLGDNLLDEELLEPAYCPASPPGDPAKVVPGSYRMNVPGCPWLEKAPKKGTVTFGAVGTDGLYYYHPSSDFHGFDRFLVRIITSTSRLNDDPADQSRLIDAQVVVEPPKGISESSVGSFDVIGVFLLGLLGIRRFGRRGAGA